MALFDKFVEEENRDDVPKSRFEKVIENLNHILSTQRDYGSFIPGLGLSDFKSMEYSEELLYRLCDEIKENIELFEPRLHILDIKLIKHPGGGYCYDLMCRFSESDHQFYLTLDPGSRTVQWKK